jgi:electron transport complex protein RnfD
MITSSPFQHGKQTVGDIMSLVIIACIPGICISTWHFGYGLILNILLATSSALAFEAACLLMRHRSLLALKDNSALLTAVLLAISIPPGSPWWLVISGSFVAIVMVKHIYGGLGQNPFNPAMVAYVFLLLSFPLDMTSWHLPIALENLTGGSAETDINLASLSPLSWQRLKLSVLAALPFLSTFYENPQSAIGMIDGMAMATPLIEYKMAGNSAILASRDAGQDIFSRQSGTGWELTNLSYLLGGLFLLYKRIISWHIPFSIIATLGVISFLFYAPNSSTVFGTPYLHLLGSATMIGAFFIATDPVSAATGNNAKIVYGIIIGLSIYSIRVWGSYLDSVALAVLFGNFCAPLLDHYFRPRVYGHGKQGNSGSTLRKPLLSLGDKIES